MRKLLGCFGTVALVLIVAAVIVAFLPDDDTAAQCTSAPAEIVADIENGLPDGVTLADTYMERADDRGNVWFVAARVNGEVGVWATSRISDEGNYTDTGLIYSVGSVASDVSNWGDGGRTDAELSVNEGAAQRAVSCVNSD